MSEIKPALTAEEWANATTQHGEFPGDEGDVYLDGDGDVHVGYDGGHASQTIYNRHRAAALALYEQPFGFTHEDVALLRNWGQPLLDDGPLIDALIARIAALLPPETP